MIQQVQARIQDLSTRRLLSWSRPDCWSTLEVERRYRIGVELALLWSQKRQLIASG